MAGRYSMLPLGQRVRLKVIGIIREEMNRIGAQGDPDAGHAPGRRGMYTGANVDDTHLRGVAVERDIRVGTWADLREFPIQVDRYRCWPTKLRDDPWHLAGGDARAPPAASSEGAKC
jgi:hypothetical protein